MHTKKCTIVADPQKWHTFVEYEIIKYNKNNDEYTIQGLAFLYKTKENTILHIKYIGNCIMNQKATGCPEKRVWRYQRGNRNPQIEGQTRQLQKEKGQKAKQLSTKHTH
jgi:hypothetical protein